MIITITNRIHVANAPKEVKDHLFDELSLNNPEYINRLKMGRWIGKIPKKIVCCTEVDDGLIMPRGYVHQLVRFCKMNGIDFKMNDNRRRAPQVEFEFNGTLRDYQAVACQEMLSGGSFGTLCAPTGSGKTLMAIWLIVERKVPAIIIVHTKELLFQWIDRIEQFMSIPADEIGVIGNGKKVVGKKITVSLVQSLYKIARGVSPAVGHVICDESHRCPSRVYTDAVSAFDSEYMLALSATPYRRDGLTKMIFWYMGDMHHEVSAEQLKIDGNILRAEVIVRETSFTTSFDPIMEYQKMMEELVLDIARNELIAHDVAAEANNGGHGICLILSDRKAHCLLLAERIENQYGIKSSVLTGDVPAKKRKEIVANLRDGKIKVLIATGSLIGEGFDLAELSVLFLATPVKFGGRLLQYLGRVLRPAPGKDKAIVYDYVDFKVGPLIASFKSRKKVYRSA